MAAKGLIVNLLDKLEEEGKTILAECEKERGYTHRTYNLHDSYGFGIYVNGKLERKGFLTQSPVATEGNKWYKETLEGRKEINNFLQSYKPSSGGIQMIVVAAMPYAEVLENASGGQTRKYRVISMSYDKLKKLSGAFPGSKVDIISTHRNYG